MHTEHGEQTVSDVVPHGVLGNSPVGHVLHSAQTASRMSVHTAARYLPSGHVLLQATHSVFAWTAQRDATKSVEVSQEAHALQVRPTVFESANPVRHPTMATIRNCTTVERRACLCHARAGIVAAERAAPNLPCDEVMEERRASG